MKKDRLNPLFLIGILYLPGTFLHELSHFLMAKILGLRVFGFSLMPTIKRGFIEFGSVTVSKSSSIKLFLVAIAPLLAGLIFVPLSYLAFSTSDSLVIKSISLYFLLSFLNMSIPSKKDIAVGIKGGLILFIVVIIGLTLFLLLKG